MFEDLKRQKRLVIQKRYDNKHLRIRVDKGVIAGLREIIKKLKLGISLKGFINQILRNFIEKK